MKTDMTRYTVIILTYLFGFIITYMVCKILRNESGENKWKDVFITLAFSIFSWFGLCMVGLIYLIYLLNEKFTKEPPKWL
jgi:biotin transporter BioY